MDEKELIEQLRRSNRELMSLYDVNRLLQTSLPAEEKLYIILTSLTADDGFGYNRAFLLLTNEQRNTLEGWLGVGPLTGEQAREIWEGVAEVEQGFEPGLMNVSELLERAPFDFGIRGFVEPIKRGRGHPVKTVISRKPFYVKDAHARKDLIHPSFQSLLSSPQVAFIPIKSRSRVLGVMAVESHESDTSTDENRMRALSIFGNLAAIALENAELNRSLEERLDSLRLLNRELQEAHAKILRLDRLSTMGTIAAGVAHEIKNPLNSLLINLDLLHAEIAGLTGEGSEAGRLMGVIEKESGRIVDTLSEFLSYTRTPKLALERTDVRDVIELALALMEHQAGDAGVKFERQYTDGLSDVVADQGRLKQAFINVIVNAIQAMPEGGTLTIKTSERRKKQNGTAKTGMVCVEFADTGCGIPTEAMWRLFDPFYTTKPDGTGLGLPIVESVLRQHGGKVKVDCSKGCGATVCLEIPVPDQDEGHNMPLFGKEHK
jgi:two-component system, NtrC family, sensor histidine kinase HydH